MPRSSRSDSVRKALIQAKLETGGNMTSPSPSKKTDYKEKIDQLKKSSEKKKKEDKGEKEEEEVEVPLIEKTQEEGVPAQTVETVSEEDEYVRVNVSEDSSVKKDEDIDVKTEDESSGIPSFDEMNLKSSSSDDVLVESPVISTPTEENDDVVSISPKVGLPDPVNKTESIPDGVEFKKSHAVFTVAKDAEMTDIFNVWVPFNCTWEELTEAIQNKVKINSNKSILKLVLTEHTGDPLSPDIKTAVKFFKIYQNFEPGNSTFVLTIDLELEEQLQVAKDLAAFRAAALRLTFVHNDTRVESYVYVTRSFSWDEILQAAVLEYEDVLPSWISHIIMLDSDGDEISPPISSVEKFWKFTRTSSMHNGDMFVFYLDEAEIANYREMEAQKAFLASCETVSLQVKGSVDEFTALVPLHGDWDMIRQQIAKGNPECICDHEWITQLLLVDAEGDNLSPVIDGDAMFWKVFPTFNLNRGMKYVVSLDATMMEEHVRRLALEAYRKSAKHLRITLANDQAAEVGDIYVPHQCEWELLTQGVAEYMQLSSASWIDYFVLLDHEHDPISPPLKNIGMFWKACEKFSIEKNMVLNVYLKPEAISTLKELAFLSKANSFCVRLGEVGEILVNEEEGDEGQKEKDEIRIYVNPDSNWIDMTSAMAQALGLDSYEWIENVVLIDDEGDVLSPFIKSTEKFWRFYKKSLDKSIFLVNQDEALKAGAIAKKRKQEEDSLFEKKERERLQIAGMKAFSCMVLDHEVDTVPAVECRIRLHADCNWEDIFTAIDETGVTESVFVKYLLLVDSAGQRLSVPIKDAKMFWKFAPTAEKSGHKDSGNYFEIHLDFPRRTEILKQRELDRVRNMQKKAEVVSAVGDQSTTVLLFADSTWADITALLVETCGLPSNLEGCCIKHLVLYDIDGDQMSPCLSTTESFWGTYQTIYQYDRNMQFVITLDEEVCKSVAARKAQEEFIRTAFKFKLCLATEGPSTMKDVLVAPKALWQDIVSAIALAFDLDALSWVHHIVLLDGDGDSLSKKVNDTTIFWKTAASYQFEENKYFELYIDSQAVEATRREQAHEAFMKAAEHISIRKSPVSTSSRAGTLHAIFDSPWLTICKSIVGDLGLSRSSRITQLTLIDDDLDELSPSVCTAEKFWKIYKNNYKHDMGMSFLVEYDETGSGDIYEEVENPAQKEEAQVRVPEPVAPKQTSQPVSIAPTQDRKEELNVLEKKSLLDTQEPQSVKPQHQEQLDEKETVMTEVPVEEVKEEESQEEPHLSGVEEVPYEPEFQFPDVEIGYDNQGSMIKRTSEEQAELEAAYLQACMAKNLDQVVHFVEQEGANPLATNKNQSTAAHFACASGDIPCPMALLLKLYQYGVSFNSINVAGARPVSCAVVSGDVNICRCLLHYCPEIDLNYCSEVQPLLHQAVTSSNMDIIVWLHEMQVDVNVLNPTGESALVVSIETTPFDLKVTRYLVMEMGADIYLNSQDNFSPLHAAANAGIIPAAEFLVEVGIPVDCTTSEGKTPLMFACAHGHVDMAKLLHSQGASLYACGGKTDKLNTCLHLAAQFGHLNIIQWLVAECKMNPSPRNSKNAAPIDFARAAKKTEVFEWLTNWIESHPASSETTELFPDGSFKELEDALFRNDFATSMDLLEGMSSNFTPETVLPHHTAPLHFVAAAGYLDMARYLVGEGCNVNVRSDAGRTPLHYAAFKGHTDMCIFLHECGASVTETDNGGLSCAKIAKQNNYQNLSMWLRSLALQDGSSTEEVVMSPSPKKKSSTTFGGLFSCVSSYPEVNEGLGRSDSTEQTDQAIGQGGDNDGYTDSPGHQPDNRVNQLAVQLHEACILGDLTMARDLVEKEKAPINGSPTIPNPLLPVDEQELTPLHGAVSSGNLPLVQFLVKKGAHINAQNVGGLFNQHGDTSEAMTPLHIACDKQHESIVMYLVGRGADLYKKNMAGDTSLHIICLLGMNDLLRQIVDLPRSTLPDLNLDVRSSHLLNLLHCAADAGSIETANILIENNVGVNSFDDEKKTPMHYACAKGSINMVKLLLKHGAIVDLADTSGRTPFLFACSADNVDLLKYLIERGAQLDYESSKGNTALHIACKFGRLDMVMWLVENGLKADRINSSGHSPLFYAQGNGFTDVVDWLENN